MADFNLSILAPARHFSADASVLTAVVDRALETAGAKDRWQVVAGGFWCHLTPRGQSSRTQGWKLHISATPNSAETVLTQALPILLENNSQFKFASTIDNVAQLNARNTPRGNSGKFITIYPDSDTEAVRIAEALHRATVGLDGPRVLSDQPYQPGSLVHYRYGAFVEDRKISNDGFYAWTILDPDGNPVEDRRVGQYLPPAWVECPFPQPQVNGAGRPVRTRDGVLIGDRFLTHEAIRQTNKGGVYRGVDTDSGAPVIIKEARAHVAASESGKDARDLLRAEARALERIAALGVAPRMLSLFEQSQHLFLAEDLVPGMALREWLPDLIRKTGWRHHIPAAMEMVGRLVELMELVHQAGIVLRDFNPNNIMVLPDGELRLIDLELAVAVNEPEVEQIRVGTPGYGAPEQMEGSAPALEADYYSLGATICSVLTGANPYFLEEVPPDRSLRERLSEWLAVRAVAAGVPREVQELILGLMQEEPARRWTPAQARSVLTELGQVPGPRAAQTSAVDGVAGRLDDQQWQHAVDGMVSYLLTSMSPTDDDRLWPVSCAFGAPDPCSLQLGACGVLGVLTRYVELVGDQRAAEAVDSASRWLVRRVRGDSNRPPGLYFGDAGIAWSLYEAGRVLGDNELMEQGLMVADTLPVSWSSPDVTHGTAGMGFTLLHLGMRTGHSDFIERASKAADSLVATVRDEEGGLIWQPPAEFDSRLTGRQHYGFAHGTAGVGNFLLAVALAGDRPDCFALARQAGETLLANATVMHGIAHWGPGPGDPPTAPYWCHGASGIGSFLTRLYRATGDERFDAMARRSARAVMDNSWRESLGQCHGLAGNGEFLLDMSQTAELSQPAERASYEADADHLARLIFSSRTYRDGHVVFPNEHGGVSATWGDGISGILSFFLRLRHRSPRLWMVDSPLRGSTLP